MRLWLVLVFIAILASIGSTQAYVQQWSRFDNMGDPASPAVANSMVATPSGNYIVAGYKTVENYDYCVVTSYSRSGSRVWFAYIHNYMSQVVKVVMAPDGSIYVLGYFKETASNYNAAVVRLSQSGQVLSSYNVETNPSPGNIDYFQDVCFGPAGAVYLLSSHSYPLNSDLVFGCSVVRLSLVNDVFVQIYSRTCEIVSYIYGHPLRIFMHPSGRVHVVGMVEERIAEEDYSWIFYWVLNSDGSNHLQGLAAPSGSTSAQRFDATSADFDQQGNVYIGGMVKDRADTQPFVFKINLEANQVWTYLPIATSGQSRRINKLKVDKNSSVSFLGTSGPTGGNTQGFVGKLNAVGALLWEKSQADPAGVGLKYTNLEFDQNSEIYAMGESKGYLGMYLHKYNTVGGTRWSQLVTKASGNPIVYPVDILTHIPSGDVGVGGHAIVPNRLSIANYRQAAVPIADVYSLPKNTTLSNKLVTVNDRYYQGSTANIAIAVSTGTLSFWTNGLFTYTPPANYTGAVTFTYRLTKPGLTSNIAKVTINVK